MDYEDTDISVSTEDEASGPSGMSPDVECSKRLRFVDGASFVANARSSQRPRFLVDGLLPSTGLVYVVGAPLAGKSNLVACLLGTILDGGQFAGLDTEELIGERILLAALEHTDRTVGEVLDAAAYAAKQHREDILEVVSVVRSLDIRDDEEFEELLAHVQKIDARIIVVDAIRRAGEFDENSSKEVSELGSRLNELVGDSERLVIAIHHANKNGSIRGSTDFVAQSDSCLSLKKTRDDQISVQVDHHCGPSRVFSFRFVREIDQATEALVSMRIESVSGKSPQSGCKPQKESSAQLSRQGILQALGQSTAGLTTTELRKQARQCGARGSHEVLDKALNALAQEGLVLNASPGQGANCWQLTADNGS